MRNLLLLSILFMGLTSCEPTMCEDCYTYTYSDGTSDWVCVEYQCDDYTYYAIEPEVIEIN